MRMKKIFFLMFVFVSPHWMFAQSMSPSVIASTGGFSSNANYSMSYTVAEMTMVQTFSAGANILTQGFQQPNDQILGLIDFTKDEFGSFVVYPNPVVDNLRFGFEFPETGKVSVLVYDVLGQKLEPTYFTEYINGKSTGGFDVSALASGSYYASLTFESENTGKSYLITKPFQIIN